MLDFLGIGAQKAGTTWLYEMLRLHPALRFPGGKEMHFWNMRRGRGVDWYQAQFAAQAADGKNGAVKNGEITPAYAILPPPVIAEIHAFYPALRILYILRDPLARAWSAAQMALARAELTIDEASDQWFIDHFRSRGSRARGDYEACLRNWRAVFGDAAVLVLRHEMIVTQPRAVLEAACRHIGVDPAGCARIPAQTLARPVFAGPQLPLRPSLLPVLREIYLPKIDALERYLGIDLGAWKA